MENRPLVHTLCTTSAPASRLFGPLQRMQARKPVSPVPQPIPYQGSKRRIAPQLLRYVPVGTDTLFEAFAGSGALGLAARAAGRVRRVALTDTLAPLIGVWSHILRDPEPLCGGYAALWHAQTPDPRAAYEQVRAAFNADPDPARLLYLLTRCVKNAVRFNADGAFNQSPDHRRAGTHPRLVRRRVLAAHALLRGSTCAVADYAAALTAAGPADVVYLDPPYAGVSSGRDRRYHAGLDLPRLVAELRAANARGVAYMVTLDGRCGARSYGPGLPADLGLTRVDVPAGRSSQATLTGRAEQTVESLYVSPALERRL